MRTTREINADITKAKLQNSCGLDYKGFVSSSYFKGLLEELELATAYELESELNDTAAPSVQKPEAFWIGSRDRVMRREDQLYFLAQNKYWARLNDASGTTFFEEEV